MTKDALSARLALSERTDFLETNYEFYFSPFIKNLKPLYVSLKNKLIYPNVMIMKQDPRYAMHRKEQNSKNYNGVAS